MTKEAKHPQPRRRLFSTRLPLSALALVLTTSCLLPADQSDEAPCDLCGVAAPTFSVVNDKADLVCQLTGHFDYELLKKTGDPEQSLTLNKTMQYNIWGLDLGASFEHDGKLWFVFGDTFSNGYLPIEGDECTADIEACIEHNSHLSSGKDNPAGADSIAHTVDSNPDDCIELSWVTKPGNPGQFENNTMDTLGNRAQHGGVSDGKSMYVWMIGGDKASSLGYSDDNGQSFTELYDFSEDKFGGPSPERWDNVEIPGLEEYGQTDYVMIFSAGGGDWKQADAYLAAVPLAMIRDKSAIRYFSGLDGRDRPTWSNNEADAAVLIDTIHPEPDLREMAAGCVGTFRAHYDEVAEAWIGIYDCYNTSIELVSAALPWGPWSEPVKLFAPFGDGGYCGFMHSGPAYRQGLGCSVDDDPIYGNRTDEDFGNIYAPNIIKQYTKGDRNQATIYFNMSTWHPYNDVLMKAQLKRN